MHIVIDARNRRASTGRYTDRLIEHLQNLDKENTYTLLLESDDPYQPKNPNFKTAACNFEQFSFNPLDQLRFAWQIYRLKPNLVHFSMTQQPVLYFGNIVTTTHDLTMLRFTRASRFPEWLHAIGMGFYKFMFWWSHKKSKKIIVPTQFVADDLATRQPFTRGKTVVTYEASEPPITAAAEPLENLSKPFIFHVGSPFPHKNIQRLIKAFEILNASHPELKLVLPGKIVGQFKQALEAWISVSPAKDSIVVPGFISDEQLKWLYENAECYVLPSLSEGFGLPGLEAMSHGCPLASSNATCLPEVYQDAALYFNPTDVNDIAEKVQAIMDNPKVAKDLVQKGKKLLPRYSWEKMAQETLAVYKEALRAK